MGNTDKYCCFICRTIQNLNGLLVTLTVLAACSNPEILHSSHYVHLIYQHPAADAHADSAYTLVFIEGDGVPWIEHGSKPATDPTPFHALAFNLYKSTRQAAWYLTRPCYNHVEDPACSTIVWTDARYSEAVVDSMVSVINAALKKYPAQHLILIGYSGGGTLALLMAPRIPQVIGVITIAGNLDINSWTNLHGYQPLTGSLNPATSTELQVPHVAMIGDRDINIPFSSLAYFLQSHPHTLLEHFPQYDHVCCWEKNWPALLNAALTEMNIQSR